MAKISFKHLPTPDVALEYSVRSVIRRIRTCLLMGMRVVEFNYDLHPSVTRRVQTLGARRGWFVTVITRSGSTGFGFDPMTDAQRAIIDAQH